VHFCWGTRRSTDVTTLVTTVWEGQRREASEGRMADTAEGVTGEGVVGLVGPVEWEVGWYALVEHCWRESADGKVKGVTNGPMVKSGAMCAHACDHSNQQTRPVILPHHAFCRTSVWPLSGL
jgi:hypothetical protein